ncbi:MAG: 4-oxalomesaconate tautomerase [Proteobacteria bacterium]|nr:4-oxalomesaconate tautomerase [Pseudomonadota bacterium]
MTQSMTQATLPCTLMRAGTSRGPFFLKSDLPSDTESRDQALLAAIGSPDARQIDGVGGGTTLTSKVAIISPSSHPHADIDYQFAQVAIDRAHVDTDPSCGNMLSGVAPFALDHGLVHASGDETNVRIRDVNTGAFIEAVVQTPHGRVQYDGDTVIDGVPGTAAPIRLNFQNIVGSKTGALLPTGNVTDEIAGVTVTCIDAAMPMVLIPAASLGKTGHETMQTLDADDALHARIEEIRLLAGERMGLGDVSGKVIPKVALLSKAAKAGSICSRYFTPTTCHAPHAVTGAIAVATASVIEGSVAEGLADTAPGESQTVSIEHPSGQIDLVLDVEGSGESLVVRSAGLVRTARRIMSGDLYIPTSILHGDKAYILAVAAAA